jgi:hypothetical protein
MIDRRAVMLQLALGATDMRLFLRSTRSRGVEMPRPCVTLDQPLHIRGPTSLGRGVAVGAAGMGNDAGHPSPYQPPGCGSPQMKRSCTPWEGELGADRSDSGLDDRGPRDIHGLLDGNAPGQHGRLPTVEEREIPQESNQL